MDLGPADRITADAVGEPGLRVFYLQARVGTDTITVIVEKQQVQLLATSVMELLADLELETDEATDEDLSLLEPLEPRWRAGRLSIGYDQERDLFMLEIEEFRPEENDDEDAPEPADPRSLLDHEPETIRLWATRRQMLALSRHGIEVAERGRPSCQFCGNPMDPEGHACPAMNGHSARD
jgi:uncharacterized repeat protein (TIGR03847 family)